MNIGYIIDYKTSKSKVSISMLATANNEYYTEDEIVKYGLATEDEVKAAKEAGTPLEFVKAYKIVPVANNVRDMEKQFFKSEEALVNYLKQTDIELKNAAINGDKLAISYKNSEGKLIKFASLKRFIQEGYKGIYPVVIVSEVYNTLGDHLGYRVITSKTGKVNLVTKDKLLEYCENQIVKALVVEKYRDLTAIKDLFKPIQNAKMSISRVKLYSMLKKVTKDNISLYNSVKEILDKYLTEANDIEASYISCYSTLNPFPKEFIVADTNKYAKTLNSIEKELNKPTILSTITTKDVEDSYAEDAEFTEAIKDTIRNCIKARKAYKAKSSEGIKEPLIDEIKKVLYTEVMTPQDAKGEAKLSKVIASEQKKLDENIKEYSNLQEERNKLKISFFAKDSDNSEAARLEEIDVQLKSLEGVMTSERLNIRRAKAEKALLKIKFKPANKLTAGKKKIITDAQMAGLDSHFLGLLNNPMLSEYRMKALVELKHNGYEAEYLASPDWTLEQFNYLYATLNAGIPIEPLINFNYNTYIMTLIRKAVSEGVDPTTFANPTYSTTQMNDLYQIEKDKLWCDDLEVIEGTKFIR